MYKSEKIIVLFKYVIIFYRIVVVILCTIAILATCGFISMMFDDKSPNDKVRDFLLSSHIKPGGELVEYKYVHRIKICDTSTTTHITDSNGRDFYYKKIDILPKIGDDMYFIIKKIPNDIALGPAKFYEHVEFLCPGNLYQYWFNKPIIAEHVYDFTIVE